MASPRVLVLLLVASMLVLVLALVQGQSQPCLLPLPLLPPQRRVLQSRCHQVLVSLLLRPLRLQQPPRMAAESALPEMERLFRLAPPSRLLKARQLPQRLHLRLHLRWQQPRTLLTRHHLPRFLYQALWTAAHHQCPPLWSPRAPLQPPGRLHPHPHP